MGFRDEKETLRRRVEELERALSERADRDQTSESLRELLRERTDRFRELEERHDAVMGRLQQETRAAARARARLVQEREASLDRAEPKPVSRFMRAVLLAVSFGVAVGVSGAAASIGDVALGLTLVAFGAFTTLMLMSGGGGSPPQVRVAPLFDEVEPAEEEAEQELELAADATEREDASR